MARLACGGTNADWVYTTDDDGDAQPAAGGTATFWDALDGGNQYGAAPDPDDGTGLVDGTGTGISQVTLDSDGFLPEDSVYTPDGVTRLAIDASGGSGPRRWIYPNDPVALSLAANDLAQQAKDTADAALAAGGGGGAVSKVAGVGPDATGNVPLSAGNVGAVASKAGNSVDLAINDQWIVLNIADEDNVTSPNRFEWRFQGAVTGYFNEYGELRVIAGRPVTTPIRAIANSAGQSGDLFQACDYQRNPLGGFRSDGRVFAPNVGTARASKGTTSPSSPSAGDIWTDTSSSPPVLRVYDGSVWIVPSGAGGGVSPDSAPAFMAATAKQTGGGSHIADTPSAGETFLAILAWNGTDEMSTVPDGWTLVDEMTGAGGRAGLWIADASVEDWTWSTTGGNISSNVLGYQKCSVSAHAALLDSGGDNVHTAPSVNAGTVPATIMRAWWDKTSLSEAQTPTLPESVSQRALEAPESGSMCTVIAADAEQTDAGAAGAIDATFSETANNAGGFTVALVAAS